MENPQWRNQFNIPEDHFNSFMIFKASVIRLPNDLKQQKIIENDWISLDFKNSPSKLRFGEWPINFFVHIIIPIYSKKKK